MQLLQWDSIQITGQNSSLLVLQANSLCLGLSVCASPLSSRYEFNGMGMDL